MIPRFQLFEIHDLAACPPLLRSTTTELLRLSIRLLRIYDVTLPLVLRLLRSAGTARIVDLCAGSGGPWSTLHPLLERATGEDVQVELTDKFPSAELLARAAREPAGRVALRAEPVDATATPADLRGARTLFSSFHHFPPEVARAILRDAALKGVPIGVFEGTRRSLGPCVAFLFTPLAVLLLTPFVRPLRLDRAFFTYAVPVFPLAMLWDGMVSNLRTYTKDELRRLVSGIEVTGYDWEVGQLSNGWRPAVTYLLGFPRTASMPSAAVV